MNSYFSEHFVSYVRWEEYWPYAYTVWSDTMAPSGKWEGPRCKEMLEAQGEYKHWQQINKRAKYRAERRMRKKAWKSARYNGSHDIWSMPGAWVD